jgi:hypothetical protein
MAEVMRTLREIIAGPVVVQPTSVDADKSAHG